MSDVRQQTQRTLLVVGVLNLAVALAKAAYGWWSGSLAVATDALHSFVDTGANVVGYIAVRHAHVPPDPGHPYGHRKVESVAAAILGVVIGAGAARFGWLAFRGLADVPAVPHVSSLGIGTLVVTLVVNVVVATFEAKKGRELDSPYLLADSSHTASDVLITLGVIASQVASQLGVAWADPAAAVVVLGLLGVVAWRIVASNLRTLIDGAALDPEEVRSIVLTVDGVRDCHRARSRGGAGGVYVDLHVTVDPAITVLRAHGISHRVEDALKTAKPSVVDVVVHVEPEGDPPEAL